MPLLVTYLGPLPNRRSHTVEVLFERSDGHVFGFDLVVVPMAETCAAWFTTDGELVRMVAVGQA